MNKLRFFITILLFIMLPNIIYADCTTDEISYFKRIEDDYKITYTYNKDTKDYTVTFYSPEPDKYEYMIYAESEQFNNCDAISERETKCNNVAPDEYYIEILGQTNTCNDTMKEITLNITRKNSYVDDPLCEGIEEFVLCQPNYEKELDYETFVSRVNTYKKTKQKTIEDEVIEEDNNKFINNILNLIKENIFQIIIVIVFLTIIIVTIILTVKSIRKSRRLE